MHTLTREVRFALRSLRRSPGFTLVTVLTLALGIGATTAIFSAVNRLILDRLPFANADRLVDLSRVDRKGGVMLAARAPVVDAWRERAHTLEAVEPYRTDRILLGGGGEPAMVNGEWVSSSFLHFLGLAPALGRSFTADEAASGGPNVVMLSYALWQQRFGGSAQALGRTIDLGGAPYTIIGVMPHRLQISALGGRTEVWLPLHPSTDVTNLIGAIARLRPGVTVAQAQRELDGIQAQVPVPSTEERHWAATVTPLAGGGNDSDTLLLLGAAVAVVLLIGCANVAQLFLARGTARQHEMVVRASLGAGRARLVRQLLVEGFLLAGAGGAVGLLLAWWSAGALGGLRASRAALAEPIAIDARVLIFALAVSLLSALLFALIPALRITRLDLGGALRSGAPGSGGTRERARSRGVLIGVEVALSVVLLTAAGLLIREAITLQRADPGFDTSGLVAARVLVPSSLYPSPENQSALVQRFAARARALHLPGVGPVIITDAVPSEYFAMLGQVEIQGTRTPSDLTHQLVRSADVPADYFHVFGIPLVEGRGFTQAEIESHAHVTVIGQALAHALSPTHSALGLRVRFFSGQEWSTVVGVARDVAAGPPGTSSTWQAYLPFPTGNSAPWMWVVARAQPGAAPLGPELRRFIHTVDPRLPVPTVATMESVMHADLSSVRFRTWLLSLFAATALLLAVVGLFGVLSYAVARRTREIGIRMALGAGASRVRAFVVRQGMTPAVIGLCVGLVGSLASARLLASLFRGIGPVDPLTMGIVAAMVLASALLASYLPARRATAVDPVTALRSE